MQGFKIKSLVWTHGAKFCGPDHSYAETELGTWSMTAYSGRGGRWAYTDLCGNDSEGDWPTRDECQAAVEAAREARILAALEAPPDETAALRAKLAEVERDRDQWRVDCEEFRLERDAALADRDEERKLADSAVVSLAEVVARCGPLAEDGKRAKAVIARHAARRKE